MKIEKVKQFCASYYEGVNCPFYQFYSTDGNIFNIKKILKAIKYDLKFYKLTKKQIADYKKVQIFFKSIKINKIEFFECRGTILVLFDKIGYIEIYCHDIKDFANYDLEIKKMFGL